MGSDPGRTTASSPLAAFQFALPHGERPCRSAAGPCACGFNSRSRMGSDGIIVVEAYNTDSFNSRSRMGSDCMREAGSSLLPSFNSRSRMGSDVAAIDDVDVVRVSIRAPAWGATSRGCGLLVNCNVSIRAPAWGATFGGLLSLYIARVSIRAPAWGATSWCCYSWRTTTVSIRAPAWGATDDLLSECRQQVFQFALPHGERLRP